jgi:hypothetical protein
MLSIPYRYGSTNTYGGLRMMRTEFFSVANGDRETNKQYLIYLDRKTGTLYHSKLPIHQSSVRLNCFLNIWWFEDDANRVFFCS